MYSFFSFLIHFLILIEFVVLWKMDLNYPVVDCHIEQHRKPDDNMLMGSSSRSPLGDKPFSSKYSERLSPSINQYLLEAARQEVGVCISSGFAMLF